MHDEVELLARGHMEPRTRERKRRPRDFLQAENLAIEAPRAFEIARCERDVMQGFNFHRAGREPHYGALWREVALRETPDRPAGAVGTAPGYN